MAPQKCRRVHFCTEGVRPLSPFDLARILRAAADEAERIASEHPEAPSPTLDDHVTLAETGHSVRSLRRAIRAGELAASKVGRSYMVRRADLSVWLESRRVTPRPVETAAKPMSAAERAIARAQRGGALRVVGGGP